MRKNIGQQNKEDAFIQEVNEELKNERSATSGIITGCILSLSSWRS